MHEIFLLLGPQKSLALPAFLVMTGYDTTSAFFGKGKNSAWAAWRAVPEVTGVLQLIIKLDMIHRNR